MIEILLLGGTISRNSKDFYDNSMIKNLISNSRITSEYKIHDLFAVDSQTIDDKLVSYIIEYIQLIKCDKILIVMGTDRMIQVSQQVKKNITNKIIIFVGAFIPFSQYNITDASFNFGSAFGILNNCLNKPAVFICMHGQLLDPDQSKKDYKKKIFVKL